MYALSKITNGLPTTALPYHGHVLIKELGQYGLYMFSGTAGQLTNLGGEAQIVPIVALTDNGVLHYPEMNNNVSAAIRTKMNNWLTARGLPNIPAGWTYRRLMREIVERFSLDTEEGNWVKDS